MSFFIGEVYLHTYRFIMLKETQSIQEVLTKEDHLYHDDQHEALPLFVIYKNVMSK